jgi:hypothetical protein
MLRIGRERRMLGDVVCTVEFCSVTVGTCSTLSSASAGDPYTGSTIWSVERDSP